VATKELVSRPSVTPDTERGEAVIRGEGVIAKLLSGLVAPRVMASSPGFDGLQTVLDRWIAA